MIFSAHYSVGTVFVVAGSSSVVGAGTSFVGNVKAGDYLLAGGVLERIAAVVDATHLTLARPWSGATISASAYDVVVVLDAVGYQRAVADLLERLLSDDPDGFYTRAEVDGYRSTDQNAAKNASNLTAGTVPDNRFPPRLSPYPAWYPGDLGHITDYNTATATGCYFGRADAANAPPGNPWGVVTVAAAAADMLRQDVYEPGTGNHWFRNCNYNGSAAVWGGWRRVYATAAEIQSIALNASNLTTGTVPDERLPARLKAQAGLATDYNQLTEDGWYFAYDTAANLPVSSAICAVHVSAGPSATMAVRQDAYETHTARHWRRYGYNSSGSLVWTAWPRVYETAEEIQLAVSLTSAGAVGSYIFAYRNGGSGGWGAPGTTVAGSELRATNVAGTTSDTLSGAWRLMGAGNATSPSLFLRIA